MKSFFLILMLFPMLLFAEEFGIDAFDRNSLDDAVLETDLLVTDGIVYLLDAPFTGIKKGYHENGNLALVEFYRNGLQDGFSFAWYENGNKKQEFYFLKGQKHGLCYTWYKNGNMQMMAYLVRGRFSGQFKAFDQDGFLHFEMFRTDDSLQEGTVEERSLIDGDGREGKSD